MVRYLRLSLLLSAILVGVAGNAWADPATLAVLGVETVDVPEALAQQLTEALRQRAASSTAVRAAPAKDLIEIKMIFGCEQEQPACMAKAGKTLGVDKLLYGAIRKAGKGDAQLAVTLKLLDVRSGAVEKSFTDTVTKRELAAGSVSATAARWFGELVPVEAKPTLIVSSEPTGASVTVDGSPMGRTPLTLRDLAPGTHQIAVAAPGRLTQTRTIDLRAGG